MVALKIDSLDPALDLKSNAANQAISHHFQVLEYQLVTKMNLD
jgi:hypothetical protein